MICMKSVSRLLFVLFLFTGMVSVFAQCPGGIWKDLAPMGEPRQELAAAAVDQFIVTVGGFDRGGNPTNITEIYDTEKDIWYRGADLPVVTDHPWAVALDGLVYLGGNRENRVFVYDVYKDMWGEVDRSNHMHGQTPAAGVIDGKIYVAGGTGAGQDRLEVYDPDTEAWEELAPMNHGRNHTTGGVINGKLYVAGGRPGNQNFLEEYDPVMDTWTEKAPMPTGRSGIAGAVVGGCLYVFGGEGNPEDPMRIFNQVEAYDPKTDAWTSLSPMRPGRHGIYAAVIDNMIFLPGGATRAGFGVTGINQVFIIG